MIRLRTAAVRVVTVAALGLAVIGVPAAANAAPASATTTVTAPVMRQDVCSTVRSVAAPFLFLYHLGLITLDDLLDAVASLTDLPIAEVRACLGL
ncbi:hypothetical protein AB0395_15265 [Streptosporangium sp. NPDC051023]|uniref:hypothetical protein n=1 Tax=Streptosporangium sp. NPDC051023 TaxID=3155410 RepID=UPI00344BC56B